jgi:RHH-type rel operon transcriptional repressor/antitoxin RelB
MEYKQCRKNLSANSGLIVDLTNQTPLLYNVIHNAKEDPMLAIRLEKEIEQELDLLAKSKGSNRSAVVREAIVRYLEDNEDLELAKKAISESSGSRSLQDLRKELGLVC